MGKHKNQYIDQETPQNLTQLGLNEEEKYDNVQRKNSCTSFEHNLYNDQVYHNRQGDMNQTAHVESKRQAPEIDEEKKTENPINHHLGDKENEANKKKLDECPPSFKRAKTHGFANKVKQPDFIEKNKDLMEDTPDLCEC